MTHSNVVHGDEVAATTQSKGQFEHTARRLGAAAGATTLGVSLFEVPAGKTAFPYHFHSSCEEGVYILAGEGTARIGGESIPVRAGDYVAFPPGPDFAHQLTNTGTQTLRYLALSAPAVFLGMDIVGYPDSNKVAFAAGAKPGKPLREAASIMKIIKSDTPDVGYYDGEPLAK